MKIVNRTKNTILAEDCKAADTFWSRFLGLMGKQGLPAGGGLLITPCNSIHMFFMKIPLDILFIDKKNCVVHLMENIRPWRVSPIIRNACSTIELPAGAIRESRTEVGDALDICE